MFKLVALLAVAFSVALGAPQTPKEDPDGEIVPLLDGRIIGGANANIANYPYIISLQRSGSHICGGAIFSANRIVTAAHCVVGGTVSTFSIRAGSSTRNSGGQVIAASRILVHASYNSRTIDYDVAVIHLASSITVANAASISLPASGTTPTAGSTVTLTGWGATSEGGAAATTLQVVQVPVVSIANCRSAYGTSSITDRMFCVGVLGVGGRDACQGDSGGPAVIGGNLAGVVSWGTGCARPNYPGVKANLYNLRTWVNSAVASTTRTFIHDKESIEYFA